MGKKMNDYKDWLNEQIDELIKYGDELVMEILK